MTASEHVTRILDDLGRGDSDAANELLPLVYDELRGVAAALFAQQPDNHTLQPTILVHEVWTRLIGSTPVKVRDRSHFFAVAAQAMRQILTDHARRRGAAKRGGDFRKVTLHNWGAAAEGRDENLVALDEALKRLEEIDEHRAHLLELRFFGGLKIDEIAEATGLGPGAVKQELRGAQAWLRRELDAAR